MANIIASRFQRLGLRLDWKEHTDTYGVPDPDIVRAEWFLRRPDPPDADAMGRIMHARAPFSESWGAASGEFGCWYSLKVPNCSLNPTTVAPFSSYYDDGFGNIIFGWSDPCVLYRSGHPVPIKVRADLVEYDTTGGPPYTELSRTPVEYAFTGLMTSIDIAAVTTQIASAPVSNKAWILEGWTAVTPVDPSY